MAEHQYSRQEAFFGQAVQSRLRETRAAVVGLGGTGSHVAQQLAYLGVGTFDLLDYDRFDLTSLNRVVTGTATDVDAQQLKVEAAKRLILNVNPKANVRTHDAGLFSRAGLASLSSAHVVFGCVDRELPRLVINEVCQAYDVPYLDLGTEIDHANPLNFGGRVVFSIRGSQCVFCSGVIDQDELRREQMSPAQHDEDERIYGIRRTDLGNSGPSVVMLNGLVASAAVTEFIMEWSGLREPRPHIQYKGAFGVLTVVSDPPDPHCPYCKGTAVRGQGERVNVERWLESASR